jgi:hypothetical protein
MLKILNVCYKGLNSTTVKGILFKNRKVQTIVKFYLVMQKALRKVTKIIKGLKDNSLAKLTTYVRTLLADALITKWIKVKVKKSKSVTSLYLLHYYFSNIT